MTQEQVTLVQQTFGQVAPIADKAAEIFYDPETNLLEDTE